MALQTQRSSSSIPHEKPLELSEAPNDKVAPSIEPTLDDVVETTAEETASPPRTVMQNALIICMATFLAALHSTILTIALPTIALGFHASDSGFAWIGSAYLLANDTSMPFWGEVSGKEYRLSYFALPSVNHRLLAITHMLPRFPRTALLIPLALEATLVGKILTPWVPDIFRRKPIFMAANVVFMVGSLIAALSKSRNMLLAGRAIQGLGAGGLMNLSNIVVSDLFSLRDRGLYLALVGAAWSFATAVGPVVGGVFYRSVSWRWCFWINCKPLAHIHQSHLLIVSQCLQTVLLSFCCSSYSKFTTQRLPSWNAQRQWIGWER